ncbi:uncharacterized protein LOC112350134 [Selaginella moellendorffii]|uniref:uncharacterized protein LOC112350134 n=1 Tax=Selaginella moellendorffii TaxID=88036 RepID=UPI000D1D0BD5|nr:uncharacterized protein LOC112350134 [Selaginella moellendorffii]|eukprot:XP_024541579.1 uncharacterized protein LOC112350134 [Selaginella moellendorffii]
MERVDAWMACFALAMALVWGLARWNGMLGGGRSGWWRRKSQQRADCRQHFMAAAHLLARARRQRKELADEGRRSRGKSSSLARDAIRECDVAIACDPRDAAPHIVKALALQHLGHLTAALRSLNTALSPPASKSLTESERVEALIKRASISLDAFKTKRGVKAAIADLEECLALDSSPQSAAADAARQMLASCYQRMGGGASRVHE